MNTVKDIQLYDSHEIDLITLLQFNDYLIINLIFFSDGQDELVHFT